MRRVKAVPKTDLDQLAKEILSRGPDAALPHNLPDRWLRIIGRDIASAKKASLEGKQDAATDLIGPVLIVASLLGSKAGPCAKEVDVSEADLIGGIEKFGDAITAEIVGRETGVFLRQYTVQNIV